MRYYVISSTDPGGEPVYWCGGCVWGRGHGAAKSFVSPASARSTAARLLDRPLLYGIIECLCQPPVLVPTAVEEPSIPSADRRL